MFEEINVRILNHFLISSSWSFLTIYFLSRMSVSAIIPLLRLFSPYPLFTFTMFHNHVKEFNENIIFLDQKKHYSFFFDFHIISYSIWNWHSERIRLSITCNLIVYYNCFRLLVLRCIISTYFTITDNEINCI